MNKFILAAAGLVAIQASAYAQSNVTLFGLIDSGIRYTDHANAAGNSKLELIPGALQGNRWGVRGSEDLGGGLSAVFHLEGGYSVDTGALGEANILFNRQSFVGLDGQYGQLLMGRQYSIGFDTLGRFAPLNYTNLNDTELIGPYKNTGGNAGARQSNLIKYRIKPKNGFTASAAYGFGEVAGDNKAGRSLGANLGYTRGPVAVAAFVQDQKAGGTNIGANRAASIAGLYTFEVAVVSLGYIYNQSMAADDTRDRVLFTNLVYKVNAPLTATISAAQDRQSTGGKRTTYVGLLSYAFSKRSNVYLEMDYNKWSGRYRLQASGAGLVQPSASIDTKFGTTAGIRHSF